MASQLVSVLDMGFEFECVLHSNIFINTSL